MYIPSSRRRCRPPRIDPPSPSATADFTYTAVDPQDQAQVDRFVAVYRAWGTSRPVSASDLKRLCIHVAQLRARCSRLTGGGIDNIVLSAGILVTVELVQRTAKVLHASFDPNTPWSAGRVLGHLYACSLLAEMPWREQRLIRRNVVYAVVLEKAHLYISTQDMSAFRMALVPGPVNEPVDDRRSRKRKRRNTE